MSVELFPVVLGAVVALLGLAMLADAWAAPEAGPMRERRRRIRATINPRGELLVGLGFLLIAGALIGRDSWRYGTLAVLAGTIFVLAGAFLNRQYIREVFLFRGAARRGMEDQPPEKRPRLRIR